MPTQAEINARNQEISNAQAINAQNAQKRSKIQETLAPLQTQLTAAKSILDPLQAKEEKILSTQGGGMSKRALNVITSAPYTTSFGTVSTLGPQVSSLMNQLGGLQDVPVPAALSSATNGRDILRAKFQELQIPDEIIDSSISFIEALIDDGMNQEDAIDIYYNNKDFQTKAGKTLSSPFYSMFTYLREFAPKTGKAPTPLELMQFKLGVKDLVSKYGRSPKFAEESAIQNFIKNSVRLTDLDQRFAEYKIAETKADPNQVAVLVRLGFINSAQDLGDFYADSTIGQEQFQINKNTAAFAAQALKRKDMGIEFDAARLKQLAAGAGYANAADTEQVTAAASRSFESLGENLMPGAKLSGIYEQGAKMTREEALANQKAIQTELENEIFMGTASQRRKRNIAQEVGSFQSSSGLLSRYGQTGSLGSSSVAGQI